MTREYQKRWRTENAGYIKRYAAAWYQANKTHHQRYGKTERDKLKLTIITMLGGSCACCGEKETIFLCVDHRNGKGNEHRRRGHKTGAKIHRYIRRQVKLIGLRAIKRQFRILCWNCNAAFAYLGKCPHG